MGSMTEENSGSQTWTLGLGSHASASSGDQPGAPLMITDCSRELTKAQWEQAQGCLLEAQAAYKKLSKDAERILGGLDRSDSVRPLLQLFPKQRALIVFVGIVIFCFVCLFLLQLIIIAVRREIMSSLITSSQTIAHVLQWQDRHYLKNALYLRVTEGTLYLRCRFLLFVVFVAGH